MSGLVFRGVSGSLRDNLNERIAKYRTTLALQRDPRGRRADDYRRTIAMLIDMVAEIDRHDAAQNEPAQRAAHG